MAISKDNYIMQLWAMMSKVVAGYQNLKMTQEDWEKLFSWAEKKKAFYTELDGERGKKNWEDCFGPAFDLIVANQTENLHTC